MSWIRETVCGKELIEPDFCKNYFSFASADISNNNEQLCIEAGGETSVLTMQVCASDLTEQLFAHDERGFVRSKKFPNKCIVANTRKLSLMDCSSSENDSSYVADRLLFRALDNSITMNIANLGVQVLGFTGTSIESGHSIQLQDRLSDTKSHKKWLIRY